MSVSHVGTDGTGTGTTSASASVEASRVAGDLIVAVVGAQAGVIVTPTGFTQVGTTVSVGSTTQKIFGKISDGTETTVSSSSAGTRTNIVVKLFRASGFFTTVAAAMLGETNNTGAAATATSTALTNVRSGAWLLAATSSVTGGTGATLAISGINWSTDNGPVPVATDSFKTGVAKNTVDTGTANTVTVTWSSGNNGTALQSLWIIDNRILAASGAIWTWTGAAASILYLRRIVGVGAVWTWSGATASLLRSRLLVGGGATWTWTGAAISLLFKRLLVGGTVAWSWVGGVAHFVHGILKEQLRSALSSVFEAIRAVSGSGSEQLRSTSNTQAEQTRSTDIGSN